jgi:hypothetical protein
MGYFENPNRSIFNTDLLDLEKDVGVTAEAIGLPSHITHMVQCVTHYPYLFNSTSIVSKLKNSKDLYEITIGEPNNDYKFILETENYITGIIGNESIPTTIFLIGNPNGANIFL